MMIVPRRNSLDLFDDMFNDPYFETSFYKQENALMKTDIKENDTNYTLEIDIPGYDKKDIKIELNNGYLTITATKEENVNEEDKNTHYIHKEKFYGEYSRNYFIGEDINENDINATFRNGTLNLTFPKKTSEKIESKKYIKIND